MKYLGDEINSLPYRAIYTKIRIAGFTKFKYSGSMSFKHCKSIINSFIDYKLGIKHSEIFRI